MVSKIRSEIIGFLERRPSSTVEVISVALGVTKENIHYHLQKMRHNGMVQRKIQLVSKPAPRGRPIYHYNLTNETRLGNIKALADSLLNILSTRNTSIDLQTGLIKQIAREMFPYQPFSSSTQNLRQTMQRLNQHHYQASWEARATGPFVILRNCPYSVLIQQHPELCLLDRFILSMMLNESSVTQTAKMDFENGNPPICTFVIKSISATEATG